MADPRPIEQPQAVAEAFIGKEPAAGVAFTPEQEAAKKIREQRAGNVSERKISEGLRVHPPPTEATVNNVLNENFGTKRRGGDGPDAGQKDYSDNLRSRGWRELAEKDAKLARELIERGYDRLSNEQKNAIYTKVLEAARTNPDLQRVIDGLGGDKRAIIEARILRDNRFAGKLNDIFNGTFSAENVLTNEDDVNRSQETYDTANRKATRVDERLAEVTRDYNSNKNSLDSFKDLSAAGGVEGEKYRKLQELNREVLGFTAELQTNEAQIRQFTADYSRLANRQVNIRQDREGTVTAINDPTEQMNQVAQRISELQARNIEIRQGISEQQALEAEQKDLEQRLQVLRTEKQQLEDQQIELHGQRDSIKGKLDLAKAHRAAQEEEFKNKVQGMVAEATEQFIEGEAEAWESAQQKALEKQIAEEKDRDKKKFLENVYNEFIDKDKLMKEKKAKKALKVDNIKTRMSATIGNNSPDEFVQDMLTKGLSTAEQQRVLQRLKDEKDFAKEMQDAAVSELFKKYISAGGKFTEPQLMVIRDSEWGQGMIKKAIEDNKTRATELSEALGDNILNPGFMTKLKKASGESFLKILLVLLGAAVVGTISLGASAKNAIDIPGDFPLT